MSHLPACNVSTARTLPIELKRAVEADDCSIIAPRHPILLAQLCGTSPPTSRRWVTMRNRRAHILAMTRRLIAEESYEQVVMRRLADLSEVTVPTIYNLIGGRDEVLEVAVREALRAKVIFSRGVAEIKRINPILAFVETIWTCLAYDPNYSRQLVNAIAHKDVCGRLRQVVLAEIGSCVEASLKSLELTGGLRRTGISTQALTVFIVEQIGSAVVSWAKQQLALDALRLHLAQGTGLLLLGMLGDEEALKVTSWLKQLESPEAMEPRIPSELRHPQARPDHDCFNGAKSC